MDFKQDWDDMLKSKYCSYTVEVKAYLDSLEIATSSEISMSKIYDAICDDEKINENLKLLYREALFGSNKDVKSQIQNRIANFRRGLRGHPKVKRVDMLHAADYGNMQFAQMTKKMEDAKHNVQAIAKSIDQESKKRKQIQEEEAKKKKFHADIFNDSDDDEATKNIHSDSVQGKPSGYETDASSSSAHEEQPEDSMHLWLDPDDKVPDIELKPKEDWKKYIELDSGDVVYSEVDNEFASTEVEKKTPLKVYGKKLASKSKLKLTPKKTAAVGKIPENRSKGDAEFERVLKESKTGYDELNLKSDDEKKKLKEMVEAFDKGKAQKSNDEKEDEEALLFKAIKSALRHWEISKTKRRF